MGAIAGAAAIQSARTTFETVVETGLKRNGENGIAQLIGQRFDADDGLTVDISTHGAVPAMQQREESHVFTGLRTMNVKAPHNHYQAGVELPRAQVVHDKSGTVGNALRAFQSEVDYFWALLVVGKLDTNPTGIDGSTLINDTHAFGANGGTWDNDVDAALTFATWNTAQIKMGQLRDEWNQPLDLTLDTLIVNPAEMRTATEILKSELRPVSVATDSSLNGVVGGSAVFNVYKSASITLIVTSRITAGNWFAMDSRYKPIAYAVWSDPQAHVADDMTGAERMSRDVFQYSVEADATAVGFQPWGLVGRVA